MKLLLSLTTAAVATAAPAQVTCKLTVDNHIDTVKYNNVVLTATNGDASRGWNVAKHYTFTEAPGARLDVVGREDGHGGTCLGTQCSGFAMECQDSAGGAWDKFASTTDGSCKVSLVSDGTKYVPAVTTSGFSLRDSFGTGHTEIWAQGAAHNEWILFSCAPMTAAEAAKQKCKVINANDFSSLPAMVASGWTSTSMVRHHHTGVGNHDAAGAVCNNGDSNWWGWRNGAGVGQMEIDSPVTSTATIDFGNCWNQGEVKVYVDGREVGSAAVGVGSEVVSFAVKKGERISVRDEGANSVMRLNSLTFASCKHTECEPEFCSTWNCDMWCKCFEPTLTAVYESFNCFDDNDDSCSCIEL